jgi:hypothetical protein
LPLTCFARDPRQLHELLLLRSCCRCWGSSSASRAASSCRSGFARLTPHSSAAICAKAPALESACPGQALWSCAGDATANSRAQRHRSACLAGAGGPASATSSFTSAPTSGLVLVLSDDDDEDALDSDDRQPVSSLRTNGPYGPGLPTGQPAAHAGGGDGRCSVACIVRPPHRQLPAGATLALRLAAQSSSPWLCIIEPRRSTDRVVRHCLQLQLQVAWR